MEEEQILEEFTKVKQCLQNTSMDDDTFEAARETCLVLGGKLGGIRRKQDRCYTDTRDLEIVIDKEIVECRYEDTELSELDLTVVRCQTPVRQISPTPLDRWVSILDINYHSITLYLSYKVCFVQFADTDQDLENHQSSDCQEPSYPR